MKHVVMFSGGITSWAAAKRVVERFGTSDTMLLFADTLIEDEDSYRFLEDAAKNVGAPLIRIAEGRTPFEVFRDQRFLGNSHADLCSRILKREAIDRWRDENCDPAETVIYFGLDFTEEHRIERIRARLAPWEVDAPLLWPPLKLKNQHLADARAQGLRPPRLYEYGFSHANCGGGCVKAGQAHFARLLEVMPARFARWEAEEEMLRAQLGDVSILTDRSGDGVKKPLPLRVFREKIQAGPCELDMFDWGGCGCFTGTEAAP
jgi:hypothetical protein